MTQRNIRGAYYCPEHDYKEDWDFLAAWQPNVVRLMLEGKPEDPNSLDVGRVKRVHDTCPDATIVLRCWDIDDRSFAAHDAMVADPKGEAERQVKWWSRVFDNAVAAGVPRDKIMAGLNNETGPDKDGVLYPYTEHALTIATPRAMRLGVLVFSNGRPSLPGEAQYTIDTFAKLDDLIIANNGARILHEYMQPEGMYAVWTDEEGKERHDWTYLMGRHTRWPFNPKVPVIIGEWGLNGIIYNRYPDPKYGDSGWRNFKDLWPPSRYADEYVEYIRQASANVIGVCPFLMDFKDHKWQSFELRDGYSDFLARKDLCVREVTDTTPVTVHIPAVNTGPSEPPQPTATGDNWPRIYAFIRKWEGGWSDNPVDPGGATNKGITYGTFVNWRTAHGQPTPSKDDLRAISDAETEQIYHDWYYVASGADKLPWPLSLAQTDTAVNAGVGRAQAILAQSGGDFLSYVGHLIQWYASIPNFETFGRGWMNRRGDLLIEASQ